VDTEGLLLKVVVSAANVSDAAGARLVGQALQTFGPALARLTHLWADAAYGGTFVEWARAQLGWEVEVVKRPPEQRGFAVHPRRWVVERTFGWWSGLRRLAKDYEYQAESSEAMIYAGMISLMTRRLARAACTTPHSS
jgi:putative transposase